MQASDTVSERVNVCICLCLCVHVFVYVQVSIGVYMYVHKHEYNACMLARAVAPAKLDKRYHVLPTRRLKVIKSTICMYVADRDANATQQLSSRIAPNARFRMGISGCGLEDPIFH